MVSILIPVYNVEKFILRCLESVANQTYKGDLECIIVDDCGNDKSVDLAKTFIGNSKSHVKFRIIRHEQNRGLAAARNTGIDSSRGEFVIHLDSDDWLSPDAIELLVEKQRETNADIVSGNAMAHYDNCVKMLAEPDYTNNMDMVRQTILQTMDHVIWRRLIRKSLYTDNDIRAEEGVNIGEDHHTLPRLAYYAKTIAKVNSIIYHYNCMNPNSYMQGSKDCLSIKRYSNDTQSIQILKDFFSDKKQNLVDKLNFIEEKYKYDNRQRAIFLGDKESYIFLCKDQNVKPHYFRSRIKCLIQKNLSFVKHNILKLMHLIISNVKSINDEI